MRTDGREIWAMRILMIAAAMLALVATPVSAQMGGKRGNQGSQDTAKADPAKKKADDKAYKAALDKIPEPKEKYDPWGVARPADSAAKPK